MTERAAAQLLTFRLRRRNPEVLTDLLGLLHEKGWIVDPQTKAKSVVLTEEGERLAHEFLGKHFGRRA